MSAPAPASASASAPTDDAAAPSSPAAAAPEAPVVSTGADTTPADLGNALAEQVKAMALSGAAPGSSPASGTDGALPGSPRFEIEVGKLDPRLKLAPCQRVEPHLPAGIRLWGKTRIGLRCVQGPTKWNVYLPITVKVFGKGLVAVTSLPAATPLSPADFAEAEVDLAAEQGNVVTDPSLVAGRTLYGPMAPGQVLRQSLIKPRKFFDAGDTVTITASGPGFSASGEGQALTNGMEGMPARIKIDNGKILSGVPISNHRVDVKL